MSTIKSNKLNDYELIKKSLDATNMRGKVISQNMSNINTKGYKKYSVSFEETLKSQSDFQMKITNERHITENGQAYGEIKVERDNSNSMREDGNNVDLDMEKANQAANTLMYNALITQANSKLSNTRYVITSGGR
ncbi:flagellar basal-body rod protein FlgB [Clostridium amylolyticum]|uniref:Flagellar basal body rod protein FlgB n=1 Tax=Clostridium amylolyticum TaxID=1121298 RepID=A0A1M6CEA7_9CLOT|nr:flagellar basal body rod protein FlgB [Clostridium amylolyticum]SHI59360.1 flagellar basal-body rod protein FlgB [Clostridium amylolyticum]